MSDNQDSETPKIEKEIIDVNQNGISVKNVTLPNNEEHLNKQNFLQRLSAKKKSKTTVEVVSLASLFRYATPLDVVFMLVGIAGSIAQGVLSPLMVLVFGQLLFTFTVRSVNLCTLNYTALAIEYCSPDYQLTVSNYFSSSSNCHFNMTNATTSDFQGTVVKLVNYLVALGCASIVLGYIQVIFWSISAERQTRTIRQNLFRSILRKEMVYFDTHKIGELDTKLTDDIDIIHDGIGDKLGSASQSIATFLGGVILGFAKGWKLTLVVLAISPLLFLTAIVFARVASNLTVKELKAYAKAGAIAEEVFSSIRTVLSYNGQEREGKRYEKHLEEAKRNGIKKGAITGFTMGLVWFVIYCAYALGFWYGAKLIRDERYDIGDVSTVFFCIIFGVFNLGQVGRYFQFLTQARAAAYIIWKVIDTTTNLNSDTETGLKKDALIGDIHFSNVQFCYPVLPNVQILNNISFDIKSGQTIALAGSSGSGKSTCIQLLQRLYDTDSGSIFIDGQQITEYNLKWLRNQIGVVSHEPVLFQTTIRQNILLGKDTATDIEIHEAAKMANAHDFIMTLPDKYETRVGEGGATLSGGQKQRIAIARTLIRDPKILLLDEATSALNNESEKIVQEVLDRAAQNRTTLVIAHRLSTICNADKIIVMDKGEVIEEGNHELLMRARGTYFNLVEKQNLRKTEEEEEQLAFEQQENARILSIHQTEENQSNLARKRVGSIISLTPSITTPLYGKNNSIEGEDIDEEENNEIKTKKKEKKSNAAFKMFMMNKPEWIFIAFGCVASLCNGGIQLVFGIILSKLIAVFQECDKEIQKDRVLLYILLFIGLGILILIVGLIQDLLFACSGEALTKRLRFKLFHAILRQEIAYFDNPKNNTGALCTRLATEASAVQGATGIRIGTMLRIFGSLGTGIIISFVFSWQVTLLVLGFVLFMVFGDFLQSRLMIGLAINDKQTFEEAKKITVECMQNIRTVVQLTKEDYFYEEYCTLLKIP